MYLLMYDGLIFIFMDLLLYVNNGIKTNNNVNDIHSTAIISDNFILILQFDTFSMVDFISLDKFSHIFHYRMISPTSVHTREHSYHQAESEP